jgi:tRNA(His) 5'-end guanylyltransferase
MKFDNLDARMRVYETAHDHSVLPDLWMVARLDGRGFTRLTKDTHDFERPFDERFRDLMTETTRHLMTCGFQVVYGYHQSDEISLLLHRDDTTFGRKLRKLNSVLAGEASATFSTLLGDVGVFDCRISQLPSVELVIDYFRWRQSDAHRNALNAHCYWLLRGEGLSEQDATARMEGASVSDKNELLFSRGINFNDLPAWHKRGVGVWWETYQKEGYNPVTDETEFAERRRLRVERDLPYGEAYDELLHTIIKESTHD